MLIAYCPEKNAFVLQLPRSLTTAWHEKVLGKNFFAQLWSNNSVSLSLSHFRQVPDFCEGLLFASAFFRNVTDLLIAKLTHELISRKRSLSIH